jgi:hypothetical protein
MLKKKKKASEFMRYSTKLKPIKGKPEHFGSVRFAEKT